MILTDEEIYELHARHYGKMYDEYTRAIEAVIMAKLEVVAYGQVDGDGHVCGVLDFENPPQYVTHSTH